MDRCPAKGPSLLTKRQKRGRVKSGLVESGTPEHVYLLKKKKTCKKLKYHMAGTHSNRFSVGWY
jgi:hypothetical protein